MKISDLKPGYHATGNKGHIFGDEEAHIAKNGLHPRTLCGIPMLFTNYVSSCKNPDSLGICVECLYEYNKQQITENNAN